MDVHRLIGKRKKKKEKCPNPLFERWLLEWKNDASSKGLKSVHTYSRVCLSGIIAQLFSFKCRLFEYGHLPNRVRTAHNIYKKTLEDVV